MHVGTGLGRRRGDMAIRRGLIFLGSNLRTEGTQNLGIPLLPQASPLMGVKQGLLGKALSGGPTVC